jgi:hypothetical protein
MNEKNRPLLSLTLKHKTETGPDGKPSRLNLVSVWPSDRYPNTGTVKVDPVGLLAFIAKPGDYYVDWRSNGNDAAAKAVNAIRETFNAEMPF